MKRISFAEVTETVVHDAVKRRKLIANNPGAVIQTFNDAYLEPGKTASPHKHEDGEEVFYFLEGAGKMVVDGDIFQVKSGDCVTIKKGEPHEVRNDTPSSLRWISIRVLS